MTVTDRTEDWPEPPPKPPKPKALIPAWPPAWSFKDRDKSRQLAFAGCGGDVYIEGRDQLLHYDDGDGLRDVMAGVARIMLYMVDDEFNRYIPYFLSTQECVWSDSAEKIVAFRLQIGRTVRWIYRANVWPGLEADAAQSGASSALQKLRGVLDDFGVGDQGTPGALGQAKMRQLHPKGAAKFRPPWAAWQDLYDHLIAGRTELLQPFSGKAAVELDINNAYAAAIAAGVPAGHCFRIFCEQDAEDAAWWYGYWKWRLPADAGVDYGRLGVRSDGRSRRHGTKLSWPTDAGADGQGWYTADEIASARDAGYLCEYLGRGWGWTEVSTDFAQWAQWMDAAKTAYKTRNWQLEATWVKAATVSAIGRFGMDRFEKHCWRPEDVGEQEASSPILSQEEVALMLTRKHCAANRSDLLIHVCVQVHAYVRAQLLAAHGALRHAGLQPCMSNIDSFYVPGRHSIPPWALGQIQFGSTIGLWKQKTLDLPQNGSTIEIQKPGWVIAGNLIKTPGVTHV